MASIVEEICASNLERVKIVKCLIFKISFHMDNNKGGGTGEGSGEGWSGGEGWGEKAENCT